MKHGGARKRDNSEAGQVKREKRSNYWDRLQKKLDKHKHKWKFSRGNSCGGTGR
jgi:hypothetical protein